MSAQALGQTSASDNTMERLLATLVWAVLPLCVQMVEASGIDRRGNR